MYLGLPPEYIDVIRFNGSLISEKGMLPVSSGAVSYEQGTFTKGVLADVTSVEYSVLLDNAWSISFRISLHDEIEDGKFIHFKNGAGEMFALSMHKSSDKIDFVQEKDEEDLILATLSTTYRQEDELFVAIGTCETPNTIRLAVANIINDDQETVFTDFPFNQGKLQNILI